MADRNSTRSQGAKKKGKKAENKTPEEKNKDKTKEKAPKKAEKIPKQPAEAEEGGGGGGEAVGGGGEAVGGGGEAVGGGGEAVGGAEVTDGDFEPIELPPFEIVTGKQMSPFYFKFQFRNVEYSSGRNKTLLCFRVETPGGAAEPLTGYLEDEHATAHAEDAFFHQVLPEPDPPQGYDLTWYVSSSPCSACVAKLTDVLRQRPAVRLTLLCSRLFQWEEPEIGAGLRALAAAGCKLRMMAPADFLHVWETYVEKEEGQQGFSPWEDCQDNCSYYTERLASILQ